MRAEWILPEDKKLDVTLKILNSEKHLTVSKIEIELDVTISWRKCAPIYRFWMFFYACVFRSICRNLCD